MARQLEDVADEEYAEVTISGDRWVDFVSTRPVRPVELRPATPFPSAEEDNTRSLDGEWKLASSPKLNPVVSQVDWPSSWMHWAGQGGPTWWEETTDRSRWLPVNVPTTVQNALIESGELPDPLWAGTTYDEQLEHGTPADWQVSFRHTRVEQQDWWFARTFIVPAEWTGSRVELRLDGISYSASVYINGKPLGNHEGMFGGPTLDITGLARFGAENTVVVRVDSAPPHWYGRPIGSAGFGWHYGHLIPMGIWRSVGLRRVDLVDVRDLKVTTTSVEPDGTATLRVGFDLENPNEVTGVLDVRFTLSGNGNDLTVGANVDLTGSAYQRFEGTITVPDAAVWWPLGFGDQPLYEATMQAELRVKSGARRLAQLHRRIGIRTTEMAAAADWIGEDYYRWQLIVNGVPLFMKGANWCSTDPLLRGEVEKYRDILNRCSDANIQVLRAWGAGVVEDDYFYDLCDERGILVYQEFPITWGPPDSPHSDLAVIDRQAHEIVTRLRHHPSVFMWGGGNENLGPVSADEVLRLIGRRCRQFDPDRPFHRSDPWGGSLHNYEVFHGGHPIDTGYQGMDPVLYGEWGLPSLPSRPSLERYLPNESMEAWPPRSDDTALLQHQPEFRMFDFTKQARYANFGPIKSFDDMVEYTQLAQSEALRYAANLIRGSRPGHTTGFWFYKATDLFPGNSWAVIDYYGVPKSSFYTAKRVCRNVAGFAKVATLDFAADRDVTAAIWAANDSTRARSGTVEVTFYDNTLRVVQDASFPFDLAAYDRAEIGVASVPAASHRGELVLFRVSTVGVDGEDFGDDWYWVNARPRTERILEIEALPLDEIRLWDQIEVLADYAADRPAPLRELPRTALEAVVSTASHGGWTLTVRNTGDVPAFPVIVDGLPAVSSAFLSDNWFGLVAGEQRAIDVRGIDTLPPLTVRAWNADSSAAKV
ncbi:sugar-binding domain-containing protein [Microbacterium sp.]|uniref:glycoside hydrolase family 2 protein n=1 Tax=Microbacterium sp. TaxID=51671 RepID=UPI0025E6B306|nr:sugar-binding domain-containing protein [Microbacterium sp.]